MKGNANHLLRRAITSSLSSLAATALTVGIISSPASAGNSIPASADVAGLGTVDIGSMAVTTGNGIHIDFTFAPGFSFLDDWYDFQWVSIEVGYSIDGVPQATDPVTGTLPAIDPQQWDGPEPYYYNDGEWSSGMFGSNVIHTEGSGSSFIDFRMDPGVNSVITFHTFLVANSVTDPGIGPMEFCVLGGIEWTYAQSTGTTAWTASLIPSAGNASDINDAMANGNPPFDPAWDAVTDCELSACPLIWDCCFCSVPTVTFSASNWTEFGKIIGQTFSLGTTPQPAVPDYDDGFMPVYPNDWHWTVDYPCGTMNGHMEVDVVDFGPNDHITVQAVCSPIFPMPLHLFVDYGANFYILSVQDGPPIFQGPWNQYPSNIPPQLQFAGTGNIRRNFTSPPTGIVINEIRIHEPGTDNNEYFELMGPPGASLNGLTYLVIGDGTDPQGSGVIEAVVPLNGVIQPSGFYVVAESTFTLGVADFITNLNFENDDNVTHLLVKNFSGTLNQDLDLNNDGTLDFRPWQTIVDLVALIKQPNPPTVTEYSYGPPALGPDTGGLVPSQVYRCSTDGLWRIGKFDPALGSDTPSAQNILCNQPPPPTGGCCMGDGSCFQATQTTCVAYGGLYQGNGTDCGSSNCAKPCPGDVNHDGVVNVDDLLIIINSWGPCPVPQNCPADINHNGVVNVDDLLAVINGWGPC